MPVNKAVQEMGPFDPEEVALFWRVFDATSSDNESDGERDQRASRIIANYAAGISDEDELTELSRKPLGR